MEVSSQKQKAQALQSGNKRKATTRLVESIQRALAKIQRKAVNQMSVYANRDLIAENLNEMIEKVVDRANNRDITQSTQKLKRLSERESLQTNIMENGNLKHVQNKEKQKTPSIRCSIRVPPELRQLKGIKVLLNIKHNNCKAEKQAQNRLKISKISNMFRILQNLQRVKISECFNSVINYGFYQKRIQYLEIKEKQSSKYEKGLTILSSFFDIKRRQLQRYTFNQINVFSEQVRQSSQQQNKQEMLRWCIHKIALSKLNLQTSLWRLRYDIEEKAYTVSI